MSSYYSMKHFVLIFLKQGLSIDDLEDLIEDIKVYKQLEQGRNAEFWKVRQKGNVLTDFLSFFVLRINQFRHLKDCC